MAVRRQIAEWLEGEPAGDLGAPTPRDEPRPAPEPSVSTPFIDSERVDLAALRRRLITARELTRRATEADRPPPLVTALPQLDRLLEGGLARGELVELVGDRSSGRFSLVHAVLAAVTGVGEAAALIDLGDGLQPADAEAAGVALERLLWLRPERSKEALAGAEMVVAGGFPLVVVDLGVPPVHGGRGSGGAWVRLARAAERHGAALLVSAPYRVSGPAAARVLSVRRPGAGLQAGRSPIRRPAPAAPLLVLGLDTRLRLEKARGGPPGGVESLRLLERPHLLDPLPVLGGVEAKPRP